MKKPYERPRIVQHVGGVANKFGMPAKNGFQDEIDGVPVAVLKEKYGSPLFVYSERTLRSKHHDLMRAFGLRYPRVQHAWSYKTNYLKAICRAFDQLGSMAEVVSGMEYEMARRLGVPASRIIFNGPVKPIDVLRRALTEGATVNIDSLDELEDSIRVSHGLGRVVKVGLRFNMSLGSHMSWDRYGFNLESGAASDAIKRALSSGGIQVVGYHAHIGTFVYDPENYRSAITKLLEFHQMAKDEYGIRLEYLDVGGGFASKNKLKGIYLPTSEATPSFDRYAESICGPILEAFPPHELPQLILESGRAMIDEAGSLITSISAVKRLNNGKRGLVVDSGVNLLFTSFWYDHEVIPAIDRGPCDEDHVIYGCLCMQIDVLRDQIKLPALERGDSLIIRPVGAYNNTQWMQFIALRPNVVMIGESGEVSLIRKAETVDYLQEGEAIPVWMRD